MALGDTARLNWSLRNHRFHYPVKPNGPDFDVFYPNIRHDNATGANQNQEIYIGTVRRESMYPWTNFMGRPVFTYTNRRDLRNHEALTEALAVVDRHPRATAKMQV